MAPKQTINSSVKVLERKLMLKIDESSGRKHKIINLTEKGESLAKESVIPLYEEEINSVNEFSEKEMEIFLKLRGKFYSGLRAKLMIKGLLGEKDVR